MALLGRLLSSRHNVAYHWYADDTQVCFSAQPAKHEPTIIGPALVFKFPLQMDKILNVSLTCLISPALRWLTVKSWIQY